MSFLVNAVSRLELSSDHLSLLGEFKQWVEKDADFYGRSEDDFLVLFLRSCDFDLTLSKKTLRLYYKVRLHNQDWWTNRNLNSPQFQFLLNARAGCTFLDQHPNYPTAGVLHVSRCGPDPSIQGTIGKLMSCGFDLAARRPNCQLHGAIMIFNLDNLYWWMVWKCLNPLVLRDLLNSFLYCVPIRVQTIILVNGPSIASTAIKILQAFLPIEHKKRIQCCKSWSEIGQFVPLEVLPEECGGHAGPIKVHDDAIINEMLLMKDYFLDDDKYGFQV